MVRLRLLAVLQLVIGLTLNALSVFFPFAAVLVLPLIVWTVVLGGGMWRARPRYFAWALWTNVALLVLDAVVVGAAVLILLRTNMTPALDPDGDTAFMAYLLMLTGLFIGTLLTGALFGLSRKALIDDLDRIRIEEADAGRETGGEGSS